MKGGSVASDAVANLVKPEVYETLNNQFDDTVKFSGGSKGKKKQDKKQDKKPTAKSTSSKQNKKGGMCMACGGSLMKHINEYNDESLHTLYNKKGGSDPLFTIKYDISTAFAEPTHGQSVSRTVDNSTLNQMTYENPTSFGVMNKSVQYGNVTDSPVVNFSFGGAKKQNTKNSSKKTKETKDTKDTKQSKDKKKAPKPKMTSKSSKTLK
jgi:hypothetical protein